MHDAILDRWVAGETETQIVAALRVDIKVVRNAIERARYHKDPRGVRHGHDHGTKYTDEQIATVKRLWTDGHPSSHIARVLRVTRNVVIGLVYRLGLPKRAQRPLQPRAEPMRQQPSRKPVTLATKAKPAQPRPRIHPGNIRAKAESRQFDPGLALPPVAVTDAPVSRNLSLLDLTEHTCRWPLGDPGTPGFGFCGHQVAADRPQNLPYCGPHIRMALPQTAKARAA